MPPRARAETVGERLAISPQCGFNSAGEGNRLSHAEQEAKLKLVGRLARQLWRE